MDAGEAYPQAERCAGHPYPKIWDAVKRCRASHCEMLSIPAQGDPGEQREAGCKSDRRRNRRSCGVDSTLGHSGTSHTHTMRPALQTAPLAPESLRFLSRPLNSHARWTRLLSRCGSLLGFLTCPCESGCRDSFPRFVGDVEDGWGCGGDADVDARFGVDVDGRWGRCGWGWRHMSMV
ncbi:hypothetical protein B0H12DRAFT_43245 [Mycena haematopus]|nr:hypothetical protein B0H12DRAFT_43245 [Mycena haematopus]